MLITTIPEAATRPKNSTYECEPLRLRTLFGMWVLGTIIVVVFFVGSELLYYGITGNVADWLLETRSGLRPNSEGIEQWLPMAVFMPLFLPVLLWFQQPKRVMLTLDEIQLKYRRRLDSRHWPEIKGVEIVTAENGPASVSFVTGVIGRLPTVRVQGQDTEAFESEILARVSGSTRVKRRKEFSGFYRTVFSLAFMLCICMCYVGFLVLTD